MFIVAVSLFIIAILTYLVGMAARLSWEPKPKTPLTLNEESRRDELEKKMGLGQMLTPEERADLDLIKKKETYFRDPKPPQPPGWHTLAKAGGVVLFVVSLVVAGVWLKMRDGRVGEIETALSVNFEDIAKRLADEKDQRAKVQVQATEALDSVRGIKEQSAASGQKAEVALQKAAEAETKIAEALTLAKEAGDLSRLQSDRIVKLETSQAEAKQSLQKAEGNIARNFEKIAAAEKRFDDQDIKIRAIEIAQERIASTNATFASALERMKQFQARMRPTQVAQASGNTATAQQGAGQTKVDLDVTIATGSTNTMSMDMAKHLLRTAPVASWAQQTNPSVVYTNGQVAVFPYTGYTRIGEGWFNGPQRIVSTKYLAEFAITGDIPVSTAQNMVGGLLLQFHNEQGASWSEAFLKGTEIIVKQSFEAKFRPWMEKNLKDRLLDDKLEYRGITVTVSPFKQ